MPHPGVGEIRTVQPSGGLLARDVHPCARRRPSIDRLELKEPLNNTRYLWTTTRIGGAGMTCERVGLFTNALMSGKNRKHRSTALWLAEPGNHISDLRK